MSSPFACARLVATIAIASLAVLSANGARADGVTREAALRALVQKIDLPLAREVFARTMASVADVAPGAFVNSYGQSAQLGDDWKAGNPQWDRARALVLQRLQRERADGHPVFAVTRLDVERALDVPWTEDDIRFLDDSIGTPLGQAVLRLLDAGITMGFVDSVARDGAMSDATRAAYVGSRDKARVQYEDALATVNRLSMEDPQRAERVRRLLSGEDAQAMQALGTALFRPSMRRFSSLMVDLAPQLDDLVTTFRAHR